jgi:hypothetical protein
MPKKTNLGIAAAGGNQDNAAACMCCAERSRNIKLGALAPVNSRKHHVLVGCFRPCFDGSIHPTILGIVWEKIVVLWYVMAPSAPQGFGHVEDLLIRKSGGMTACATSFHAK